MPETQRRVITESQNHRMFGAGRHLCGSSSPIPLPKQGNLQQAAQDLVQEGRIRKVCQYFYHEENWHM